jgi:hypothetical protein
MTAANPDRWAAPNYASFTGSDATPLQQTFQSLSTYLEKINNSVTIASGVGVLSAVAGAGISVSGATGAVTFTNTGVTGLTGTANQVTVSGATGAVTLSLPSAVSITGTMTAYTATRTITLGVWTPDPNWGAVVSSNGYLLMGHNSDSNCYLRTSGIGNVNIGGNGQNTLIVGSASASIAGSFTVSGPIAQGGTGGTEGISTNNWFRAYGESGLFFQSYGGGWHMTDTTWIRAYNNKNVYVAAVFRCGYTYSGNVGRVRGSYGSVSFDANGATNAWDGIEFTGSPQTFMVQNDNFSGMYRNNNNWNWLWNYSTLQVPSDIRYKREIEPLNIGLKFVQVLEPISYLKVTELPDDDPDATENGYYYGFSAQNVRAALDACGETRDVRIHDIGGPNMGLVACTEDAVYDRQFIGITEFIGPMVVAIKELSAKVDLLENLVKVEQ